jgi:hypothetical protein
LAIWGTLKFHMNLRINFSISVKKTTDRYCIVSVNCLLLS